MSENEEDGGVQFFSLPLSTKLCVIRRLMGCENIKRVSRKMRGPRIARAAKSVL